MVKDKVIIGTAGGELGIRGFQAAHDAGQERKFGVSIRLPVLESLAVGVATLGKPEAPPIWVTGTYDPELNLTYWGVGNPAGF